VNRYLLMPELASAHGGEIDRLMLILHAFMVLFFLGWLIFGFYALFRFRAKRNPKANYNGTHSHFTHYMEIGVVAFEIALLVGLSIPFWNRYVAAKPVVEDDTVEVRVLAQQYVWNVHYPGDDGIFGATDIELINDATNPVGLDREAPGAADDIVVVNQLYLPVDRPVVVHLTSKDVIHSFGIPEFRVKQDAIPGMTVPVQFTPTMTSQAFRAKKAGMTEDAFAAWADETKKSLPQLYQDEGMDAVEVLQQKLDRTFEIACAQLCGLGHYRMRGFVHVLEPDAYEAWLKEKAPDPNAGVFDEF
jgi:cytochrome c oxidase subunit II